MSPTKKNQIGVFLCHCGKNIAGGLNIEALIESLKQIQEVSCIFDNKFSCSEDGQVDIQKAIQEQKLDRIVVAACSPTRGHRPRGCN